MKINPLPNVLDLLKPKGNTLEEYIHYFDSLPTGVIGFSWENVPCDAWEWLKEEQSEELYNIIQPYGLLLMVNDGDDEYEEFGVTPQERVVNFLKMIKEKNESLAV